MDFSIKYLLFNLVFDLTKKKSIWSHTSIGEWLKENKRKLENDFAMFISEFKAQIESPNFLNGQNAGLANY